MRILVTGHLGYIGTVLVPMLLRNNHEVVGMDVDWFQRCTYGGEISAVPNIGKDIRDAGVVDLRGFDAVMHLAALSNDPLGDYNPQLTDEINHRATVRLAEMARDAGVKRFIFSSTCSNYGVAGNEFVDENGKLNPYSPYARAKVAAEQALKPLSDDRFSVTLMRSATAFGWSPRIRFDLVINNLVAHAFTTGTILMKSDGTPWRAVVHVEDIARAFTAVVQAKREQVHDQAFNVGQTQENYRIHEIAAIVAEVVPDCRIEHAPGAGPDPRCYRVNCDKLPNTLKEYRPLWTARDGARQVFQMVRKIGLRLEEFEGARYARLPHIKKLISDGLLDEQFRYRAANVKAA